MKIAVGLALAALATSAPALAGPGRMDTGKRAPRVSTEERAILPENPELKRNEVLLDKRIETKILPRKDAVVGERRSALVVEESREKKQFATPERKKFDIIERRDSPWAGKVSRYSTAEDSYRSQVATRFQDKIGDASPISQEVRPVVSQRTTFDKINRFAFRKNADQAVSVTAAGSGRAPADAGGSHSPGDALSKQRGER